MRATVSRRRHALIAGLVLAASGAAAVVPSAAALPSTGGPARKCLGRAATIVGSDAPDRIAGTRRADVIWTGDGDDVVSSRLGNDVVCTGAGRDAVLSGRGYDAIRLGAGADAVDAGPDADDIRGGGGIDLVSFAESPVEVRVDLARGAAEGYGYDRLTGLEGVIGSSNVDELLGSPEADLLVGMEGPDTLRGRGGPDLLQPHEGDDLVDGGPGADTATFNDYFAVDESIPVEVDLVLGRATGHGTDRIEAIENVIASAADDVVVGDAHPNVIVGGYSDDAVDGGPGADVIAPAFGNDVVDGGPGSDWVDYSWDEYVGGFPVAVDLEEGAGEYYTRADGGHTLASVENVIGSRGEGTIRGDAAANELWGLDGDDAIEGLAGDDVLDGGGGADSLDGGEGDDVCAAGERLVGCERAPDRTAREIDGADRIVSRARALLAAASARVLRIPRLAPLY